MVAAGVVVAQRHKALRQARERMEVVTERFSMRAAMEQMVVGEAAVALRVQVRAAIYGVAQAAQA
jgi:hypothetical protein